MKAEIESWLLSQKAKQNLLLFLLILFLPTQVGLHFWPDFAFIQGLRIDYLSPTLYFTDLLVFLFLLSLYSRETLFRELFKYISKPQVIIVLLIIVLGVILSKNFYAGFYGFVKIIEFFLLTLALAKNIQKQKISSFLPAISFGIIFESVLAIVQFQNGGSLGGLLYFLGERFYNGSTPNIANASLQGELILRPYGTFSHPNVMAGYLVILMLLLVLWLSKKYRENLISYAAIFLGTIGLVLSMSRSAILVWLFLLGFIFLGKTKKNLILVFGTAAILLVFPQLVSRFLGFSFADGALTERLKLASSALRMIWDNPFMGVGINNFLNNLPNYYLPDSSVIILQPVHNIFLLTLSQVGIIAGGLILYHLTIIFSRTSFAARCLLLAVLILGFFDHYFLTLQQGQLLLVLVLAVALADIKTPKESAKI